MAVNSQRAVLDKSVVQIDKLYTKAYKDIQRYLKNNLTYSKNPVFAKNSIYNVNKYVKMRLQQLDNDVQRITPKLVSDNILQVYKAYYGKKFKGEVVTGVVSELETRLQMVNRNLQYSLNKLTQNTFTKQLMAAQTSNELLKKELLKELSAEKVKEAISKNMTAIVDKMGRKWDAKVYTEMVTKTTLHNVQVETMQELAVLTGKDLAKIPVNPLTDDACKNYEGMVISMTGRTVGYRSYAELKATKDIFHPNCRHMPIPIS